MTVQIVSQYYHPDNFRINDIAKELASRGITVHVLTGLPDYATSKIPPEYKWFRRRKEVLDGVNVRRVPVIARRGGAFFRMLNYASFAITSSCYALFSEKPKCDVIFVNQTSPVFQAIAAIIYKWRTKKKLALYCYDLWPESLKAWNVREDGAVFKLVKAVSRRIYRSCDVIAVTSRPFVQYLAEQCGVDENKIVCLPQYAEDIYQDIQGRYEENGCVDFLFAGNIGSVQNVDCIIYAAAKLETEKRFCVHIVGDGSELENCKKLAESLELKGKVVFHGRRPLADMNEFYKLADCFLLTLRGGDFVGMTLPGKAAGYLSAGKPVLAAIGGAGGELVREAGCGETVAAGDAEALADKMKLVIENLDEYKQKGINGRVFYEKHFSKKQFFKSLIAILEG